MNKVIIVNLNGNAYQVDEAGHDALHGYLQKAQAKLAGNPDKDEIMADFEQAIAGKCAKYLSDKKTVITTAEIAEILAAMGPVEDAEESGHAKAGEPQAGTPKRLFKIREGAVFEGVCNGIAAYAGLDVTVVRVLFIVATILTSGAGIVAYILMAIFIPEAKTAADRAAANGQEFNSQTILANAHKHYQYWKESATGKVKEWEAYEAQDKAKWKDWKKNDPVPQPNPQAQQGPSLGTRIGRGVAGWLGGIGVFALLAMNVLWGFVFYFMFNRGTIFGYFGGESKVTLALLLASAFLIVFLPLQGMVGEALRCARAVQMQPSIWGKIFTWLLWFGAVAGFIAIVAHSPIIREGFTNIQNDYTTTGHIGR